MGGAFFLLVAGVGMGAGGEAVLTHGHILRQTAQPTILRQEAQPTILVGREQ